jgi:hypothetical protein
MLKVDLLGFCPLNYGRNGSIKSTPGAVQDPCPEVPAPRDPEAGEILDGEAGQRDPGRDDPKRKQPQRSREIESRRGILWWSLVKLS